jgi:translation initiation factor IF-2
VPISAMTGEGTDALLEVLSDILTGARKCSN